MTSGSPAGRRIEVVAAAADSWRQLGDILGGAFQDDPIWLWVASNERRRARHLGAMFAQTIRSRVRESLAYTTTDLGGVAVWAKPERWKMTATENLRTAVPALRTIGLRSLPKGIKALTTIDKFHPSEPHWYLEFLAAHVERRGQGYGSALLQPMLDRCDEEGMPAYLESSKAENLPFYNRFGFEVTGQFDLASGSPPMWSMWREPR